MAIMLDTGETVIYKDMPAEEIIKGLHDVYVTAIRQNAVFEISSKYDADHQFTNIRVDIADTDFYDVMREAFDTCRMITVRILANEIIDIFQPIGDQ